MRAIARNLSTERSAAKLAAEAEISAQTARSYLDTLSRVHVVEEQPAWSPHLRFAVRLRQQPKWHFCDPSLAASLIDANPGSLVEDLQTFGFFFESLAIRDLRIYAESLGGKVYHYRDDSGLEVDAIIDLPDGRWVACEVKLGGALAVDQAAKNLHLLVNKVSAARRDAVAALVVLTAGTVSVTRADGVHTVSLGHLAP